MIEESCANDYDDVTAQAVLSVLLEIGQILGAYRDRFVVIGGSSLGCCFPTPTLRTLERWTSTSAWTRKRWVTATTRTSSSPLKPRAINARPTA